jgi:hypothetical protein
MNCEWCKERLAEFLLDELPEAEAVLVHEHINTCADCMRTYRELKGTGRMLDAVPAMRAVEPSKNFREAVRSQAVISLRNIVAALPPEKRLRLEARRAARMSRVVEKQPSAPPPSVFTKGLAVLTATCVAAVLVVLLYTRNQSPSGMEQPLAVLTQTIGRVDQFFQRANEPHSPAAAGKSVLNGDTFFTGENGRARFDLQGGGAAYASASTRLTFRAPQRESARRTLLLESGEIGIHLPQPEIHDGDVAVTGPLWEVRSEFGTLALDPGTHVYLSAFKGNGKDCSGEMLVLSGAIHFRDRSGRKDVHVVGGQRLKLKGDSMDGRPQLLKPARVPAWRADLVSDGDLAGLLGVKGRIRRLTDGSLSAEFAYNRQRGSQGLDDWRAEPAANALETSGAGMILLKPGTRTRHIIPFSPPLVFEMTLAREAPRDAAFAFGLIGSDDTGVVVDVAKNATLQIREKGRNTRSNNIAARNAKQSGGTLRLELNRESSGFGVQIVTPGGRSSTLPLPLPKSREDDGAELWMQSLGDALLVEEIKLSGTLPLNWLLDRLSQPAMTP